VLECGTRKSLVENDHFAGWECVSTSSASRYVGFSALHSVAVVDFGANVEINRDYRYSLSSPVCRPHPLHHVHGFLVPSEFVPLSGRSRSHANFRASTKKSSALPSHGERSPPLSVSIRGGCGDVVEHSVVRLASRWRTSRAHRAHRKAVRLRSTFIIQR
jgi:hypothetical protein